MLYFKEHLLTLLKVSNTTHLPTKPDQVAKAGGLERKPKSTIKSSISSKAKRKQNLRNSKLAY